MRTRGAPSIPRQPIAREGAAKEEEGGDRPERRAACTVSAHFLFSGRLDFQRVLKVPSAWLFREQQRRVQIPERCGT